MRLLTWIIMVPVALAVISFSVTNRDTVSVDLWPAPFALDAPVFAIVLVSVVVGMVIGALIAWISGGKTRSRARANARRANAAEKDLAELRRRLETVERTEEPTDRALPAPVDAE